MDALMKFAVDNYLLDGAIGMLGLFAMSLIIERVKSLYFTYSIDSEAFITKVIKLVEADKVDEAITFCTANEKKPLAYVIKRILERSDRDDNAIDQSLTSPPAKSRRGWLAVSVTWRWFQTSSPWSVCSVP